MLLGSAICCYGGLCFEQCSMLLRWAVFCWTVQYVVTVVCVLSSAVCCYSGLCVEQCIMLLRWACVCLGSSVCYGGLCVELCSMLLRSAVCYWDMRYVVTVSFVLLDNGVCCYCGFV